LHARLERSTTNKVIAGVCGGIAEYLQVDPTLVRVFFVIVGFMTVGVAFLGYIVLIFLMPLPGQPAPFVKTSGATISTLEAAASGDPTVTAPVPRPADPESAERARSAFGIVLIALGAIFLFSNLFRFFRWDLVWPLVLIGVGVLLLAQRVRR
jgi:phage shock protein C